MHHMDEHHWRFARRLYTPIPMRDIRFRPTLWQRIVAAIKAAHTKQANQL